MKQYLLIFGGSGFIGQEICREALKQNIAVISVSPSGQPKDPTLRNQPLITWVKGNVLTETNWHTYFEDAFAVVNLIGILRENQQQQRFYTEMIVKANQLIAAQVSQYPWLPYLFLSANAGSPFISPNYLKNKRQAEADLADLANPVIIFRPGLIVGRNRPLSLIEGGLLYLLSFIPFISKYVQPVYPMKIERLAKRIIAESHSATSACLTLARR